VSALKTVETQIAKYPEVIDCWLMTVEHDCLLLIQACGTDGVRDGPHRDLHQDPGHCLDPVPGIAAQEWVRWRAVSTIE